jgi:MFS family permease
MQQGPKMLILNFYHNGRRLTRDMIQFYRSGPTELSFSKSPVVLLGLVMAFLAANRIFFLLLIAFKIFVIFNSDVFLYTVYANSAAIMGVLTFPLYGKIADQVGGYKFLMVGILVQPLYFVGFLLTNNSIILMILWALPLSSIIDVSLTGLISRMTKSYERSSSLGFVSGMNALGYMLGSVLVSQFVLFDSYAWLIYIPVVAPILCALLILPINPSRVIRD